MRISSIALLCMLAACGDNPPPKTAANEPIRPPPAAPSKDVKQASPNVGVADDILKICNITLTVNPQEAPKFDFDSSELLPEDTKVLDQVAACFTTGPLKGRKLQLVGRADPRGTEQYNFVLGAKRAHQVGDYLEKKSVPTEKVSETSRGNLDATGTNEAGWHQDRRVDLALIN